MKTTFWTAILFVFLMPLLAFAENLAHHGKGGVVAWFTSSDPGAPIGRLIDQKTDGHGWR